jgi:5-hydroxyisourate hydrolase
MAGITTHILDTSRGKPAAGVPVILERLGEAARFVEVGRGKTDGDGRCKDLVPSDAKIEAGIHRLTFDTHAYFEGLGATSFYPLVTITFYVRAPGEHHHVPLLLSPFGYSTYRGS